jgi:predicted PurR-regulated permease PerM
MIAATDRSYAKFLISMNSQQEPLKVTSEPKVGLLPAQGLLVWQKRFFRLGTIVLSGIIAYALFWIGRYFHEVVALVGYSILIAYLLIGVVDWLQAKTKSRRRGLIVTFVYAGILGLIVLFMMFVVPNLISQIETLANQLPLFPAKLQKWLDVYNLKTSQTGLQFLNIDWEILSREIVNFLNSFTSKAFNRFFDLAFGTINFAVHALATIVISVYFLLDGPKIWAGLMRPLSEEYLVHANNLRHSLNRCLRGYFIGQVQLAALSGVFVFIVYLSMGSRYALLLGIWQALVEIIPVVGGFLGIGLGVIIMLFDSPIKALIALVIYFAYTQIVKDNFLTPRVMGNAIGLHPVVVVLVVFIGAQIGGISGVVFALPIAGLLNVLLDYYLLHRYDDEIKPAETNTNIESHDSSI